MNKTYKTCLKCGTDITVSNYNRHVSSCDGKGVKVFIKQPLPDNLYCPFCEKECKNLNSYRQHTCRCSKNPERKAYDNFPKYIEENRKGRTAQNCTEIAKQVNTIKEKYANGYISPVKGRKVIYDYVYEEHNNEEIQKWLNYIEPIVLPDVDYAVYRYESKYCFVNLKALRLCDENKLMLEHIYIANILLNGQLTKKNIVHHIDRVPSNNNKNNLLIFASDADHKRFHNSKFAYITYDEKTHLFYCILKK